MMHETRYIDCIEPYQRPKTLIDTSHFSGLSSSFRSPFFFIREERALCALLSRMFQYLQPVATVGMIFVISAKILRTQAVSWFR